MQNNITIGMDLGDKKHQVCVIGKRGNVLLNEQIANTAISVERFFRKHKNALVVIETGTHSPWISRLLETMGHRVLIANSRKLKAIYKSKNKSDKNDAEMLCRMGRFDEKLLSPIKHRNKEAHNDLILLKSRDQMVKARTQLINSIRGTVKATGYRISKCSADTFHKRIVNELAYELQTVLMPLINTIGDLTERIYSYDKQIEKISAEKYPETESLRTVNGVGPITALGYVLTLEEKSRFTNKRSVGAYLGLVPRRDQSGEIDKQLRITKAGNGYLRRLLVGCAQYIMGPFGQDSDLRRFGLRLAQRGGKNAKRRAVVAVARKLSILLFILWNSNVEYEPMYSEKRNLLKAA